MTISSNAAFHLVSKLPIVAKRHLANKTLKLTCHKPLQKATAHAILLDMLDGHATIAAINLWQYADTATGIFVVASGVIIGRYMWSLFAHILKNEGYSSPASFLMENIRSNLSGIRHFADMNLRELETKMEEIRLDIENDLDVVDRKNELLKQTKELYDAKLAEAQDYHRQTQDDEVIKKMEADLRRKPPASGEDLSDGQTDS